MDPLLAKVKEGAARDLERLKGLKGGALEASDVSFLLGEAPKGVLRASRRPGTFLLTMSSPRRSRSTRSCLGLDSSDPRRASTTRPYAKHLPIVASMAWRSTRNRGLEFIEIDKFDT